MAITVVGLIQRIGLKINRIDMDRDFILAVLNQCNADIASRIDFKELATVDTITFTAGENTISLPSDFHKNLDFGRNTTTNRSITVLDSRRIIDRQMDRIDRTGNVILVALDYPNIYFQYSPSANQAGTIYYHRLPTDLTLDGIFPAYIPAGLTFRIFYNYTIGEMYDVIEDGVEGEKVNTMYHRDQYDKAAAELALFIGPDPDLPRRLDKNNTFFDFNV